MKSQNQISLKIFTLALLLIASCEVWAVNFGQSQTNPLLIQTQITVTNDNQYILDQDLMFKPAFSNLFIEQMLPNPIKGKVFSEKQIEFDYKKYINFCTCGKSDKYIEKEKEYMLWRSANTCNPDRNKVFINEGEFDFIHIHVNKFKTNGTGGGDWNSTSTWLGGKIPQSGDEVIVAEGDKIVINTDVYVNSLVLKTNAVVRSDSWARRIVINKDLQVSDSASIISNFGSGKLDCYITAANDGKSLISIAPTAKVNFENLKILGETIFAKGNMDVMNFSAIKQKDFITQIGTVLNIGQKK